MQNKCVNCQTLQEPAVWSRLYSQFLTMNFFIIFFTSLALATADATNDKHYIVYMGHHAHPDSESVIRANQKVIASAQGSSHEVVHHYSKSFQGFSAMLTPQQAHRLSEMDNVVSVFESRVYEIHTTHSWEFLGLGPNTQIGYGDAVSDVVVGVVDTGFWPESESYNDKGLTAIPEKFKGECVTGENFTLSHCNRKVIGARYYYKGFEAEMGPLESFGQTFFKSARDGDGHGTHTTSTIAGSEVVGASLFGLAMGTARGGAPSARLAVYKACWFNLCSEADVLAAMDDAVSDGVDILSLSLGPAPPQPTYFSNAISIGGFHAFQKDIVVSCSAGNSFFSGTVTNAAPWILTVAASTLDREFNSDVYLGNSKVLKGYSLNPFKMKTSYRLIDGSAAAATGVTAQNASFCKNNTLDPSLVKGKIVVCSIEGLTSDNRREKALFVRDAGGVGIIIIDPIAKDVGFQISIPATLLAPKEGAKLQEYLATEKYPTGMIAPTFMALQTKPAPSMAIFSSAGPNAVSPDIIKPDITAPGANILAAWSPVATVSTSGRAVDYNIISGTSMACPHVSAVAAILRAAHPSWSASAIKSAIMTTGTTFDNTKKLIGINPNGTEATPFDYGSGHVNPVSALDPGLVYDFDSKDVISFLCSTGSRPAELRNLTVGKPVDCPESLLSPYDFNYPSISVSNMTGPLSVHRTVTYYGQGPTVYNAYVDSPTGVKVSVMPPQLKFIATGEKLSFKIDFVPYEVSRGSFVFGSLTWRNGVHRVRSPIGVNVVSI